MLRRREIRHRLEAYAELARLIADEAIDTGGSTEFLSIAAPQAVVRSTNVLGRMWAASVTVTLQLTTPQVALRIAEEFSKAMVGYSEHHWPFLVILAQQLGEKACTDRLIRFDWVVQTLMKAGGSDAAAAAAAAAKGAGGFFSGISKALNKAITGDPSKRVQREAVSSIVYYAVAAVAQHAVRQASARRLPR